VHFFESFQFSVQVFKGSVLFGIHWMLLVFPGTFDSVFLRTLMVFFGSDHLRASTIQRCEAFEASHKLFDKSGESLDFREKTDD
jgi:hypothetical protein